MGFSVFWSPLKSPAWNFFSEEELESFEKSLTHKGAQLAYLLIDFNNVSFSDLSGESSLLNPIYVARFWTAVINSGFTVFIIKDSYHDSERAVTKLKRQLLSVSKCLLYDKIEDVLKIDADKHNCNTTNEGKRVYNPFPELSCDDAVVNVSYDITEKLLDDASVANPDKIKVVYSDEYGFTEADGAIRKLAQEYAVAGTRVVIMSEGMFIRLSYYLTISSYIVFPKQTVNRAWLLKPFL